MKGAFYLMKFRFPIRRYSRDTVDAMNPKPNGGCSSSGYEASLDDRGNEPLIINLKNASGQNESFLRALWTGEKLQMTVMNLPVGEEIGVEMHDGDQFIRVEDGYAEVFTGMGKDRLTNRATVDRDYGVIIPKGVYHNIKNAGRTPLRLVSIYAPKEHPYGANIKTKKSL